MSAEAPAPRRFGLVATLLLSGLATGARLVSGFVVNKFLAVYLGAPGIALIGQFLNFSTIATVVGSGAIERGVIKYAAEYSDDEEKTADLFSTVLRLCALTSLVTSLAITMAARPLAARIFGDAVHAPVLYVFAAAVPFFVGQAMMVATLNGRGDIASFVSTQTFGSLISVVFAATLPRFFGVTGALVSLSVAQVLVCGATLVSFSRRPWFRRSLFARHADREMARRLGGYTLMALTSAMVMPVIQILIRATIAHSVSWQEAGYWQAVSRISDAYLMLLTMTLSTYYVPRLSMIKTEGELRTEVLRAFRLIVPAAAGLALVVYLFRGLVLRSLYTGDFARAESLFAWQLVGDVLKMAAWVLGNVMQARAMTRAFIVTEIFFGLGYAALTHVLVTHHGAEGAVQAFAINYTLYFVMLVVIFRRLLFRRPASP